MTISAEEKNRYLREAETVVYGLIDKILKRR